MTLIRLKMEIFNDKVKEKMAKGYVDINKKVSWNGRTSLSLAMKKGKAEAVRTLLANKTPRWILWITIMRLVYTWLIIEMLTLRSVFNFL